MRFRKAKKKREYKRTFTEDEIRDAEIPSATEKLAKKSLANWVEAMREASWGGLNDQFANGGEVTDFNLNEAVFLGEPAGGFPEDRETAVGRARANKDPNHVHEWVNVDYRDGSYFFECWCLSKKTESLPSHQDVPMTVEQANAKADVAARLQKSWSDHVHAWFVARRDGDHFVHTCWCGARKNTSVHEKQILRYVGVDQVIEVMYEPLEKIVETSVSHEGLSAFRSFNNPGRVVGKPRPVIINQESGQVYEETCTHHRYELIDVVYMDHSRYPDVDNSDKLVFQCTECICSYQISRLRWKLLLKGAIKL